MISLFYCKHRVRSSYKGCGSIYSYPNSTSTPLSSNQSRVFAAPPSKASSKDMSRKLMPDTFLKLGNLEILARREGKSEGSSRMSRVLIWSAGREFKMETSHAGLKLGKVRCDSKVQEQNFESHEGGGNQFQSTRDSRWGATQPNV